MPGLIFKTKFIAPSSPQKKKLKPFSKYIEYIDRPDAINYSENKNQYDQFGIYHDYMADGMKTTGLFTEGCDKLSALQKEEMKGIFDEAQEKGGIMHQTLFSFEIDWLKQIGAASEDGEINERKLRESTCAALNEMQKAENVEHWPWAAAIHRNTEHIHIHIAMADPAPRWKEGMGRCEMNSKGELQQRGKFEKKSLAKAKSTFANLALDMSEENKLINDILRMRIAGGSKTMGILNFSLGIQEDFSRLVQSLPEDLRLWKYNANAMRPYRKDIDAISDSIIAAYFREEMAELEEALDRASAKYFAAYGGDAPRAGQFRQNKIDDLHYRQGNAVLGMGRKIAMEQRKSPSLGNAITGMGKKAAKVRTRGGYLPNGRIMRDLRKMFKKDIRNIKNQIAFEELQNEIGKASDK